MNAYLPTPQRLPEVFKNTSLKNTSHKNTSQHETIRKLVTERARALHEGRRQDALEYTVELVREHCNLGQNSPTFPEKITVNGETRWFNGFTSDGSAVYTAENYSSTWWWEICVPEDAIEQRGWNPIDRLLKEHRIECALGAFGHADELMGETLWRMSMITGDPFDAEAVALVGLLDK